VDGMLDDDGVVDENESQLEEVGTVDKIMFSSRCFVFSQAWPSWSYTLSSMGCTDLVTAVEWGSAVSRKEFEATELGDTLVDLGRAKERVAAVTRPLIFIQGSKSFIGKTIQDIGAHPCGLICAVVPKAAGVSKMKSFGGLSWRELSHKQVCGATTGRWLVGTNCTIKKHLFWTSEVSRNLSHSLSKVESGIEVTSDKRATSFKGMPVFRGSDRAPPGVTDIAVEYNSVYKRDKPVLRSITDREMMEVYDLEIPTQQNLEVFWANNKVKATRSFCKATPAKLLRSAARAALLVSGSVTILGLGVDNRTNRPKACDIKADVFDPSQAPKFGYEKNETSADMREDKKPAVKAVKSDNAQVDSLQWDLWCVDHFDASRIAGSPLVCVAGSFDEAKHGRLFTALRGWMHRLYRRRVLLGLLKFLNSEYDGKLRVVQDKVVVVVNGETTERKFLVSGWTKRLKTPSNVRKRKQGGKSANDDLLKDLKAGLDCVERTARSDWWNWSDGSRILFWRWPKRYRKAVRDGTPLFIHPTLLPNYWARQSWPSDQDQRTKLKDKVNVPLQRRYITRGYVKSLTGFFAVPKGENDIRIVYDASKCGLNDALWCPNFFLPSIDSVLRNAGSETWFGDIDLGEMFLNFQLDEKILPWVGVDVSELHGLPPRSIIARWERTLMGLRPSPHICTQTFSWAEDVIRGNRLDPNNPLGWDTVILNLPGDKFYDPERPWVYRFNSVTKQMANFFGTYIDDIRTGGPSEEDCHATSHRVASIINYLGMQDAPRKRRPGALRPGAWAGAICFTILGWGLYVSCSQEKWDKGKGIVESLYEQVVLNHVEWLDRKSLEKDVGFLVHLSRTFPAFFAYFKGIYHTMESWRCGRDSDGWKFSKTAWWNLMAGAVDDDEDGLEDLPFDEARRIYTRRNQAEEKPTEVKVVDRLANDLTALKVLFDHAAPPRRLVRGKAIKEVQYGFGDASGKGFGASWEVKNGELYYRLGTWGEDMSDQSSNLRELKNLVETLEVMAKLGHLAGFEIFICTDNAVSEAAYFNGSSSSEELFNCIVRLRQLEMGHRCKIYIFHVSGKRMIKQGSDGLSRGNFSEGTMKGTSVLEYIPFNRTAVERSSTLKPWLDEWTGNQLEELTPEGWFTRGHDLVETSNDHNIEGLWMPTYQSGKYLWSPAPAAAAAAVEELRKARHQRVESTHVFIVPRLMTPLWRKHLFKASDLVVVLPPGHVAWPAEMLEPLTIAFCFPYLSHSPWQLKRSQVLLELGRSLHEVWNSDVCTEGPLLRKLWELPSRLENMSEVVARSLLRSDVQSKVPHSSTGKRRRGKVGKEEGRRKVPRRP